MTSRRSERCSKPRPQASRQVLLQPDASGRDLADCGPELLRRDPAHPLQHQRPVGPPPLRAVPRAVLPVTQSYQGLLAYSGLYVLLGLAVLVKRRRQLPVLARTARRKATASSEGTSEH